MKPSLVVFGLGNPGKQYDLTRHNVGFQALDLLADEYGETNWKMQSKFNAEIHEARIVTTPVLLVKPHTFMNRSGESVQKILRFYDLEPSTNILIISDDIDLPLGDHRLRMSGGAGTHNGLKSIIEYIGENFPRLRIGLGSPQHGEDLANWVLSRPPIEEREVLSQVIQKIPGIIHDFILGNENEK